MINKEIDQINDNMEDIRRIISKTDNNYIKSLLTMANYWFKSEKEQLESENEEI